MLQRTTRRLALTEVGQAYFGHCQAMLAEAEAAQEAIARATDVPRGLVRVSCPDLLAQSLLAPLLPEFMAQYPEVRILLEVTGRRVDLINDGIDVALRVRLRLEESGRDVIDLSNLQIKEFAGNAIELSGRDGRILALSRRAFNSLTAEQCQRIERSARLVPLDVPTIEMAGGSVRCMIAGIHLSPRR